MVINKCILESAGAEIEHYNAAEPIFLENDVPKYYYQIVDGKIKLNNYNCERKEVLHDILGKGQSVGESALFLEGTTYPINAIAVGPCTILKLPRSVFISLLLSCPDINMEINRRISSFLHFKHIIGQIVCTHNPMVKLKALLDYLKSVQNYKEPFSFQVPFTRQEMANLTGLCVETTIRTVKTMERKKILKIRDRKILY